MTGRAASYGYVLLDSLLDEFPRAALNADAPPKCPACNDTGVEIVDSMAPSQTRSPCSKCGRDAAAEGK